MPKLDLRQKIAVEQAHPFKQKLVKSPSQKHEDIKSYLLANKIPSVELLKQHLRLDTCSFWLFHYIKCGGQGQKLFMTKNLLTGFLQIAEK